MSSKFEPGLYVAATPIGHLADITDRVRLALQACDELYAEDTRRALQLLAALKITRPRSTIHALHEHNELEITPSVLSDLNAKKSVLLISDAGTPAISDPGFRVVDAAWKSGARVVPLPGASALTALVSVSGMSRLPLCFWGFPPARTAARRAWLAKVKAAGGLAVIYEAPHRAAESLEDCANLFGYQTPMIFGRELTKQFETLIRGSIGEVQAVISQLIEQDPASSKGEMAWAFDLGTSDTSVNEAAATPHDLAQWAALLAPDMPATKAAKALSQMLKISRESAYAAILAAKKTS